MRRHISISAARLFAMVLDPLRTMGEGLLDSLPGMAFVAVLAIVTRYVLRLTRLYFENIDRGAITLERFDREWALPTYKIARLLIIAFAAAVAYPYIISPVRARKRSGASRSFSAWCFLWDHLRLSPT